MTNIILFVWYHLCMKGVTAVLFNIGNEKKIHDINIEIKIIIWALFEGRVICNIFIIANTIESMLHPMARHTALPPMISKCGSPKDEYHFALL